MLEIKFEYVPAFDSLSERVKLAVADKLIELTKVLYDKVVDNVSGKVLQKQSGALLAKIAGGTEIDTASNPMVSFVGPVDPGPKEYALEKGGEKSYAIVPTKARVLHFFAKDGAEVFAKSVMHPPSLAFGYLRLAAEEMEPLVPIGFQEAIQRVFDGGI